MSARFAFRTGTAGQLPVLLCLVGSIAMPTGAQAQSQGTLKTGDALMQCLQSAGEVRGVQRAADLAHSVSAADNFGWVPSEVSPGLWRLERKDAGFGVSLEIKLVGADGTAHCIAFGPVVGPIEADAAADRMAQSGRLGTVMAADPGQALARRYVITGLPYTAELLSYSAPGAGAVVGFSFAGVAPNTVSALQGSAGLAPDLAETAVRLCNVPGMDPIARVNGFLQAGFSVTVERSGTNADTTHTFTASDGSVMVEYYYGEMPEHCSVNAYRIGVTQGSAILDSVIPPLYPGFLRKVTQGEIDPATGRAAQCVTYEDPTNPIGLAIGVAPGETDSGGCFDNGSSFFYSSYRV